MLVVNLIRKSFLIYAYIALVPLCMPQLWDTYLSILNIMVLFAVVANSLIIIYSILLAVVVNSIVVIGPIIFISEVTKQCELYSVLSVYISILVTLLSYIGLYCTESSTPQSVKTYIEPLHTSAQEAKLFFSKPPPSPKYIKTRSGCIGILFNADHSAPRYRKVDFNKSILH